MASRNITEDNITTYLENLLMDEDLAELPVDLRDSLTFQIDKINFACKKLSG